MPEDFKGSATMRQVELLNNGENTHLTGEQMFKILYEIGSYFYNKYTLDDVFKEDFADKIRPFFPKDTEKEIEDKLTLLRVGVNVYDKVKAVYNEYIKKTLVPQVYRKVKSAEEYDHPDDVKYIEADPGYFVKVNNFKKFLTYSDNEEERQAIVEFERRGEDENSIRNKVIRIIKTADWKKALFYGTVYENPLASKQGVSAQQESMDVKVRLVSKNTYIRGEKELYVGIEFKTALYTFIVANDISDKITKPQVDLSASENIEKSEILYPFPLNAGNYPYIHKYFGEFLLPIKITVQDANKPVMVRAKVKFFSCDNNLNCSPEEFDFELPL
ncbi:MAG: hypothetical protein IJ677_05360 [Alphaproteobacteria bacterium]|nr:hypothetical protein [Alphaproteobacteria bacterium]